MRPSQLETITSPDRLVPGGVGRFKDAQTTGRREWAGVPDDEAILASMHQVHTVPADATHITVVTPMDPGTVVDTAGRYGSAATYWLERPGHNGRLFTVGRY